MDFIPAIRHANANFPRVPYLQTIDLEYSGPFDTFPARVPASTFDVKAPDHRQRYSTFVQSWLFFGLLQEYFSIYGFEIVRSDFITDNGKEGQFVRTDFLLTYLVLCFYAAPGSEFTRNPLLLGRSVPEKMQIAGEWIPSHTERDRQLNALLSMVRTYLRVEAQTENLLDEVWDSVILVADTLARASQWGMMRVPNFHGYEDGQGLVDFSEFRFRTFTDLRENKAWCPRERSLVPGFVDGQLAAISFISRLDFSARPERHVRCTEEQCLAYQVDKHVYEQRHAEHCNAKSCRMLGFGLGDLDMPSGADTKNPSVHAVMFEQGKLKQASVKMNSKSRMVAISHVWADGLGNPKGNNMPSCQLQQIQTWVNRLFPTEKGAVPFWIDTLMVPVIPKGLNSTEAARLEAQKQKAIGNMERIYKRASKILVLDRGLLAVASNGMNVAEIGARIMCSVWSRRLWTLQEGCSRQNTVFQFADLPISWPSEAEASYGTYKSTFWKQLPQFPEDHPLHKVLLEHHQPEEHINWRSARGMANQAFSKFLAYARDDMMAGLHGLYNPVWKVILDFLEELNIVWQDKTELDSEQLLRCLRGMHYRNCSHHEDEALVLASMMSRISGTAAKYTHGDPRTRYRRLFGDMEKVPIAVLFLDQPRYGTDPQDGSECRWIPQSLLSSNAVKWRPRNNAEQQMSFMQLPLPRWSHMGTPTKSGLVTHLDGLRLQPQPRSVPQTFRFQYQRGKVTDSWKAALQVPGAAQGIEYLKAAEWVLIPEHIFYGSPTDCLAVMVKMLDALPGDKGGLTRFVCLVYLTPMTEDEFLRSTLVQIDVKHKVRQFDSVNVLFGKMTVNKSRLDTMRNIYKTIWEVVKENKTEAEKWTVG